MSEERMLKRLTEAVVEKYITTDIIPTHSELCDEIGLCFCGWENEKYGVTTAQAARKIKADVYKALKNK